MDENDLAVSFREPLGKLHTVHETFELFSLYLMVQLKGDGKNEEVISRFHDAECAIVIENSN